MFGGVKLTKNADPEKYPYSSFGIGFNTLGKYSLPNGSVGKNIITFEVDMSSSVHIDNKGKDILVLGKGTYTSIKSYVSCRSSYSINFTRPGIKFCSSLHCNSSNSFLFVNATKIYQFKSKDSQTKKYLLCLGNTSVNFSLNNIKKNRIKLVRVRFFFRL